MKFTFHAFFLLLLAVLQATLMDAIAVFGAKPNLFLIYVVVYSLMCEKKRGGGCRSLLWFDAGYSHRTFFGCKLYFNADNRIFYRTSVRKHTQP